MPWHDTYVIRLVTPLITIIIIITTAMIIFINTLFTLLLLLPQVEEFNCFTAPLAELGDTLQIEDEAQDSSRVTHDLSPTVYQYNIYRAPFVACMLCIVYHNMYILHDI